MFKCDKCGRTFNRHSDLSLHKNTCDKIPLWIIELDDDYKLKRKFSNKKINAKKEGLLCLLTFEEFCTLLNDANLKSSNLGFSGDKYVLARFNDAGNYEINNCRFIPQIENSQERKISEKSREASQKNVKTMNKKNAEYYETHHKAKGLEKFRESEYYKNRQEQAYINKEKRDSLKDPRYSGDNNSQSGTFWITNGCINQKWRPEKGELPCGFKKGRVV